MDFNALRAYTKARIGLGHTGPGLPTKAWLDFAYAHACARDGVDSPWDVLQQAQELKKNGIATTILKTKVKDRGQYLMRPDLGCVLDKDAVKLLSLLGAAENSIVLMASNGLSSIAASNHLTPLIKLITQELQKEGLPLAHDQVFLVANARVGLIDSVGDNIKPALGIILIGERPGLSSPDSLAAYLTFRPQKGRVNAERNCISNIRPPDGLSFQAASETLFMLIKESMRKKLSGVKLKMSSNNKLFI